MDWHRRIREAFAGSTHVPDADVVEELAQHLRAMYYAARAEGCSHDDAEARLAQQLDAWRRDAAALRHRTSRPPAVEPPAPSASPLGGLAHDLRYAARLVWRKPHFAAPVFVTMALGIGMSTVLFSVTYGVLVKPLPWADADRLVALKETRGGRTPRFQSFTNTAYLAWRDESTTLDGLAAWSTRRVTVSGAGDADRIYLLGQFQLRVQLSVANLLLRTEGDARTLARQVRRIVGEADEALVAEAVMTLDERLRSTTLAHPRLYAVVVGSFAAFALLLTGVGLFAVLSYVFAQRTRELGVRAALGARRSGLVRLVLRQGLGVAVAGLTAGLLAAALAARLLAALLHGITAHDAVSYVSVAAILLIVAAIACSVPAFRAARLDPMRALRS